MGELEKRHNDAHTHTQTHMFFWLGQVEKSEPSLRNALAI